MFNISLIIIGAITVAPFFLLFNYIRRQKSEMSFKESVDLTNLPIVTFYQNGKKINFLLDSGCTSSVLDSNVLSEYDVQMSDIEGSFSGCSNNSVSCKFGYMKFSYKNNNLEDIFQVADMSGVFNSIKQSSGVNVQGILGTKFFTKYKYILDFERMTAYR